MTENSSGNLAVKIVIIKCVDGNFPRQAPASPQFPGSRHSVFRSGGIYPFEPFRFIKEHFRLDFFHFRIILLTCKKGVPLFSLILKNLKCFFSGQGTPRTASKQRSVRAAGFSAGSGRFSREIIHASLTWSILLPLRVIAVLIALWCIGALYYCLPFSGRMESRIWHCCSALSTVPLVSAALLVRRCSAAVCRRGRPHGLPAFVRTCGFLSDELGGHAEFSFTKIRSRSATSGIFHYRSDRISTCGTGRRPLIRIV